MRLCVHEHWWQSCVLFAPDFQRGQTGNLTLGQLLSYLLPQLATRPLRSWLILSLFNTSIYYNYIKWLESIVIVNLYSWRAEIQTNCSSPETNLITHHNTTASINARVHFGTIKAQYNNSTRKMKLILICSSAKVRFKKNSPKTRDLCKKRTR